MECSTTRSPSLARPPPALCSAHHPRDDLSLPFPGLSDHAETTRTLDRCRAFMFYFVLASTLLSDGSRRDAQANHAGKKRTRDAQLPATTIRQQATHTDVSSTLLHCRLYRSCPSLSSPTTGLAVPSSNCEYLATASQSTRSDDRSTWYPAKLRSFHSRARSHPFGGGVFLALPLERPLGRTHLLGEGRGSNPPLARSAGGPVVGPWSFASRGIAACPGLMRVCRPSLEV